MRSHIHYISLIETHLSYLFVAYLGDISILFLFDLCEGAAATMSLYHQILEYLTHLLYSRLIQTGPCDQSHTPVAHDIVAQRWQRIFRYLFLEQNFEYIR